jgi:GNAT superfamily N-acetyltransferase
VSPTVRAVTRDDDLETVAQVICEVRPEDPKAVEDFRWEDGAYPGTIRYLAEEGGVALGAATVGRIFVHPSDYPALWASIDVRPGARRQGIGSALLSAVSDRARERGKPELFIAASSARPDGIEFLLHRGFREYERDKTVELHLSGVARPDPDPPAGIVLTSLAERPDLVEGVHAVAVATFGDIPGGEDPISVGELAEFRARDVDRPGVPLDGFVVAIESATGRVVGYASLLLLSAKASRRAWHDMTAVMPEWRGRGLAIAMKRATIRWAIDHGLEALQTGNDVDNAPMRAVNARLGYVPMPDRLTMRGPIAPAIMERA